MTLVAREILETASSIGEAEAILRTRRGFVAENVLVVDAGAGEAAVLEVDAGHVERLPCGPDCLMGASNHFRTPAFASDATNRRRMEEGTTVERLARVEELIAARRGTIDLDAAVAILSDRAGAGGRPLPDGHRQALDADVATHQVVFDATERVLRVSRWPNVAGGTVEYRLEDALGGDVAPRPADPPGDRARALRVHRARALVREARGLDPEDAEPLLAEACALVPGHPEPLLARAAALVALGRRDEALPLVEAALAAPPETAVQRRALEALRAGGDP